MTILLDCYLSKEILMSKLFDKDIASEITKQLKLTNNEDEIKYRVSIMEDIHKNQGENWHHILTILRFQAFHNKCISFIGNPESMNFKQSYGHEFSGWKKKISF